MHMKSDADGEGKRETFIKKLYPDLSDEQQKEIKDFLDGYCEILLSIFERTERERRRLLDKRHEPE